MLSVFVFAMAAVVVPVKMYDNHLLKAQLEFCETARPRSSFGTGTSPYLEGGCAAASAEQEARLLKT